MFIRKSIIAFAVSIVVTGPLIAAEIYKSTDDEGNAYYTDRPTKDSEHLDIRSRPTDTNQLQAEDQAATETQASASEQAGAPRQPTPEELRAEARDRAEKCTEYRGRQTRFTENRRIYRMDESGERVYYDEDEMQAARARVDELVQKYCD